MTTLSLVKHCLSTNDFDWQVCIERKIMHYRSHGFNHQKKKNVNQSDNAEHYYYTLKNAVRRPYVQLNIYTQQTKQARTFIW